MKYTLMLALLAATLLSVAACHEPDHPRPKQETRQAQPRKADEGIGMGMTSSGKLGLHIGPGLVLGFDGKVGLGVGF